jgi:hypothetical protein
VSRASSPSLSVTYCTASLSVAEPSLLHRTGTALYWLASLRALQDRQADSYQLYLQALASFTKVMSDREAAVTRHKIAEHLIRMDRNAEAL